jgi:transcriptional regulator with AAA-type ATPase domain/polyferredoxin
MLKIPHPSDLDLEPLGPLPDNLRRFIRDNGVVREYIPGELLMGPGDTGDRIRFVVSGEASVILRDDDDSEVAVASLKPGDMFGEISFLTGKPSPAKTELVAEEFCQVVEIPAGDFERILKENPEFALALVRSLAHKIMRLDRTVVRSKQKRRALQSLISREEHVFPDYAMGDFVRRKIAVQLQELAESEGPVLIIGETGVGKEVLAHAIFRMSHHCKGVFLLLDLLRSRPDDASGLEPATPVGSKGDPTSDQMRLFFGHEEHAEEGIRETPGYMELTEEGTLLVRGIEQLTSAMQHRLLDAIKTGTFRRDGGSKKQRAKMRLIATTSLNVSEITPERHPLLHGLMSRSIVIPPLRKRRREIRDLVKNYVNQYSQEFGKEIVQLPKETLNALVNYSWPGNDMELSNTIKRAVMVCEGGILRPHDVYFDLKRVEDRGRLNLLSFNAFREAVRSPLFPAIFQSAATPFFFILLLLLFLGPADPMRNPAALFSWAVGWPTLIIGAFIWARFWCSLCPIGTLSKLAKKVIALEKPFPAALKNHSDLLVVAAVLFIIWVETATNIRQSPVNVGLLLLAMLVSAVIVSVIYERQSWCRYLCGLGGMTGVLAKGSWLEMRADRNVCISQCTANECFLGTPTSEGCPMGQMGPKLHSNRFCKLCGQCVKNCPHGALRLNLRVPGKEIWEMRHTNFWTAFLIVGMLGGLLSEMIHKMPVYHWLTKPWPGPELVKFTIVFVMILVAFNLMLVIAVSFSRHVFEESFEENYARYGLALLPLTLTSFVAFHLFYLINLGVHLPMLISETFNFEILRQLIITVPLWVTSLIQRLLIWTGLAWSLMIMYRLGRGSHERLSSTLEGLLPHAMLAIVIALLLLNAFEAFFYSDIVG